MTLADKYMSILQNINTSKYQQLQSIASTDSILSSLLSQSCIHQNISLQNLLLIQRQLTQKQIQYLIQNIQSLEYLKVIACLKKGQFKIVRNKIENLFATNQNISFKYYVNDGEIQKSQKLWDLINNNLSQQQIVYLLQKLSNGKTPQKQQFNKILKYIKILRGNSFQLISKVDIDKLLQIKHCKINKYSLLNGIIQIILGLSNTTIKFKTSKLIIKYLSQQKYIQTLSINYYLDLILVCINNQQIKSQTNKDIQVLINKLIECKRIDIKQKIDMFINNQSLTVILLNFMKNNSLLIPYSSILKLMQIYKSNQQIYHLLIQTISPVLFSELSNQQSIQIINNIPKQHIQYASKYITIKQQITNKFNKLINNQSLYCLYYFNNIQQYKHIINNQIKQLKKSTYSNAKDIIDIIKHIQFILYYSNIPINENILYLIEQLISQKIFDCNIDTCMNIYSNLSIQQNEQQAMIKHFERINKIQQNIRNTYPFLIGVLANTSHVNINQVSSLISKIGESGLGNNYLTQIYQIHLNYHLPKSILFINQDKLQKLKQSNILTNIIQKYNIQHKLSIQYLQNIIPSPKFIQYLEKKEPSLLNQLFKSNWYYYKQTIKNRFFQLYQRQMLPQAYPIQFRGSLFNDIPLVFQYLTQYKQQTYFSNYGTYMSLLYLQILCSSTQINKKQIIKYLFGKVVQSNKNQKALGNQYYTNLIWWRLFVFASYKLLDHQSKQQILYIIQFLLKDIQNKSLPVLRQYMQLLFYKLLCVDKNLVHLLIDKLKNENAVNVNAPVILSLGLYMLQNKQQQIFEVLITYISSHTAYVRALSQYYCFEYLKLHGNQILQQQQFLKNILTYIEQSKESKKLMKNIKNGVQLFKTVVTNLSIETLMTINFQKCQDNIISKDTFNQLEAEGIRYLISIFKYIHKDLQPTVEFKIKTVGNYQILNQPSFDQYINLHQRSQQLIIVASLLQKPPNFGHLVRTCSKYTNITLCFPTKNILNQPDYKELVPQQFKCSIMQLKQKDLIKYLTVQKQRNYKLIALQQTSNSVTIDKFEFPKRAVIVLGNQRIGMNSSIIDMMDHLVEIQQFGKVRSLNVHVSSVILLWNYKMGNMI